MRNAEDRTHPRHLPEARGPGLPLERVYRQLFNPDFYLLAYSKLYANQGAMTPGSEGELVHIYRKHKTFREDGRPVLRVVVERHGKKPLVAEFGGVPFVRKPEGMRAFDFVFNAAWFYPVHERSEVVKYFLASRCSVSDAEGPVQMHHIRKLADLDESSGERWEKIMAARKRKFLPVCEARHGRIHRGKHDGPALQSLPESVVR
jgi:hypothetical protein